ncbi:mediator complex, subunit Med11 [Kockiozyma suomiensis]|uniref:mediator complex, subunit Med11 n=1 Tax=Kockiozyma suomiensis TaxID=1337062 RepID=UPI0033432B40
MDESSDRQPSAEQANLHLENLQKIDEGIISLLSLSANSLSSLNSLDPGITIDQSKANFRENAESFFSTLENVTVGLRKEAKALQDAGILTNAVNAKAEWVGRRKENENVKNAEEALTKLQNGE